MERRRHRSKGLRSRQFALAAFCCLLAVPCLELLSQSNSLLADPSKTWLLSPFNATRDLCAAAAVGCGVIGLVRDKTGWAQIAALGLSVIGATAFLVLGWI